MTTLAYLSEGSVFYAAVTFSRSIQPFSCYRDGMKKTAVEYSLPSHRKLSARLGSYNGGLMAQNEFGAEFPVMLYFPSPVTWSVGPPEVATQHPHADRIERIPGRVGFDAPAAARRLLFAARE